MKTFLMTVFNGFIMGFSFAIGACTFMFLAISLLINKLSPKILEFLSNIS